jgi:hypothetical protein
MFILTCFIPGIPFTAMKLNCYVPDLFGVIDIKRFAYKVYVTLVTLIN